MSPAVFGLRRDRSDRGRERERKKKPHSFTFHVDLSRRGVGAVEVGGETRVAAGVLLESLGDDERMQFAAGDDLNVWTVLQLLALTKPPAWTRRQEKGSVRLFFFLLFLLMVYSLSLNMQII